MITLYQFSPVWGIPNASSFCLKIETIMRIAKLKYEKQSTFPPTAPKGKLPYIIDENNKIGDSKFIIEYLKEYYAVDIDNELTAEQAAVSHAFQKMIEENLYWVMMYYRWWNKGENWEKNKAAIFGSLPPVIKDIISIVARKGIRKQILGHGMGRHTEEEIHSLGKKDLNALSDFLGEKPYFMGDKVTTLDASAFGLLANIYWCPVESPLKEYAKNISNLIKFCDHMKQKYFSDFS